MKHVFIYKNDAVRVDTSTLGFKKMVYEVESTSLGTITTSPEDDLPKDRKLSQKTFVGFKIPGHSSCEEIVVYVEIK